MQCCYDVLIRKLPGDAGALADDGAMGPVTLGAINSANGPDANLLLAFFVGARVGRYVSLVIARPASEEFLRGWLLRIFDKLPYTQWLNAA